MNRKQRADVLSVACELEERLNQLKSDLTQEMNPQKRLELRSEIAAFEDMTEKLEGAL